MFFLSDINSVNFGRKIGAKDKKRRKIKGSVAFPSAAAGAALGASIPLGLALLQKRRTGSININNLNKNTAIGGLVGGGLGTIYGEKVLNKKLGLEGTRFKDTIYDRNGKFWNRKNN